MVSATSAGSINSQDGRSSTDGFVMRFQATAQLVKDPTQTSRRLLLGMTLLGLFLITGCSHLRIPSIDPTGNRIFAPAGGTTLLTPASTKGGCGLHGGSCKGRTSAPPANPFQPPPFSTAPLPAGPTPIVQNSVPPPVPTGPAFQHPPDPPPCDESGKFKKASFAHKKHLIPDPSGPKTAAQKGQLLMSPARIIAPVGSEVVVLAGLCGSNGHFVKNQPLEWMLSNDSVGQFIEVGGMQHANFNKIVPPTAGKQNGQFAYGRTGLKNILLTRGTPTPVDDIQLKEGQTYISVSSVSPGTSYVTGYAPNAEGWDRKIASTIIHWVDGRWSIPAPSVATAGTVHPLTTVVNRTADSGGLENWVVRYEIVGGAPAEFAPAGSQKAEAVTDKNGQGTVQIRQIAGQFEPGTTQVRVDVVRPPLFGQPELVVESGITSVTWSAPALTIRSIGPRAAGVDEAFNYRVEVTNPGDQVAKDVTVRTKNLPESIEFVSASPKSTEFGRQLEWKIGDLPPGGQPRVIDVQFKSKKRGSVGICFEVVSDSDRLRTEACSETEIALPCIGFDVVGPTVARVGETVNFNLNTTNQCDEPLESLMMTIRLDQGLVSPGRGNPFTYELKRLQSQESESVTLPVLPQTTGTLCFDVQIVAKNGHVATARRCLEVGAQAQDQIRNQLGLQLQGGAPMSVGATSLVIAKVTNLGNTPIDNVIINNRYSESLEPVKLSEGLRYESLGDELLISLGTLNPQQAREVRVEYRGLNVDAKATAEFTVSSPLGATANDKVGIRIEPAGVINPPPEDAKPIGIPGDADPNTGANQGLSIRLNPSATTIRTGNLPSTQSLPTQSNIEFIVKNNASIPLRNVDITIDLRPGLRLTDFDYTNTNLAIENRNEDSTQFYIRRVNELRPGEELRFVATVVGLQAGQHDFGVQAESLDTRGAFRTVPIRVEN
jgi:uncharacterized repeat protein (TIGR01451 family)